jgi:hypothetical protein
MYERFPLDSPAYSRRRAALRRSLKAVSIRLAQARVEAAEARAILARMPEHDRCDALGPAEAINLALTEGALPGELAALAAVREDETHVLATLARGLRARVLEFLPAVAIAVTLAGCAPAPRVTAYGSHAWTQNTCAACGAADDNPEALAQCPRAVCSCVLGGNSRELADADAYTDPADCARHGARFER